MKKLMTVGAAIAACAMFGATYGEGAELLHMQGFESLTAGADLDPTLDDDGGMGTRRWLTDSVEEGAAVVTAYEEASTVGGDNFLKLDTGAQRLTRAINEVVGSAADPWSVVDDGQVYLDTMVQFTATDTAPAPAEGDKIAIWLREIEGAEEGTMVTNLMITAGYMAGGSVGEALDVSNYVADVDIEVGKWYNLQVKMLQGIDATEEIVPGFVIYIDGQIVRTADAVLDGEFALGEEAQAYSSGDLTGVFPSMISTATDGDLACSLTSVSFQGSGAIDNVAWYAGEIQPPEPPAETYEVTFTNPQNAEITATVDSISIISGVKVATGKTVVFTLTPATGYEYAAAPDGWEKSGNVWTKSVVIGDEDYALTTPDAPTPIVTFTVTFSTNKVAVAGADVEVADGGTLAEEDIPAFEGGTWDVDPTNAVITCNTNFNYTIQEPEPTTVDITIPSVVEGGAYIVSNETEQITASSSDEGGSVYTLTIGESYKIYAVAAADYEVVGTNPYDIGVVAADTTVDPDDLPKFQEVTTPSWDIPGTTGGIQAIGEGDAKHVEFTSIAFTADGATVGLKAGKIDADGETFGLICKTDLTKADTIVINATMAAEKDAETGTFTITADLSGYTQLFVVGVGPAVVE